MSKKLVATFTLCSLLSAHNAFSSDACVTTSIQTEADVNVSDGTSFQTRTWYHLPNASAIQHIRENGQIVAVDGPFGWAATSDKVDVGNDFYRQFAIGHQFHAILLRFEEVVSNVRTDDALFDGASRTVARGDSPFGGTVALVLEDEETQPAGLLFELPGAPRIEARFTEWRNFEGQLLPSVIVIDDTEREFEYRFSSVSVGDKSPTWFFDAVPAPASDEIGIYRLHRKLLAAHCMGDAQSMANLSMPETVIANRGDVQVVTREETSSRFTSAFERFDYTMYTDLIPPVVTVSESGDLGWIAVNVEAKGVDRVAQTPFEDRWAWIMMTQKVDGAWLHAGNASNRRP